MKRSTSPRRRARLWFKQGAQIMTESAAHVRVIEDTSAYWRVLFDYPPFNIVDATIFEGLQDLLARMDASPSLRVVVFESANPEFYLAHFDLTGKTGNITTAVGPSGLPILMDTFVRLTKSPAVSIAKIRGCVRGVSSEFVLACDMRFASRENTLLGQPEVGVGVHPGGGGTERLPHLVGRGRALEIVLGANDFDGDTAERYGYVNRALPDAELDGFVDGLARRIASFDQRAIAAAKNLVNRVSLPSADRLLAAITSFETALTWPETQQRIKALLKRGLQREGDFEHRWPAVLDTHCSRRSHLAAMRNPRRANRAVPGRDIESRLDAERRQAMPYSISTLLIRNLRDVFGENDPARRRAAIDEIYTEDCVFYDPSKGVYRGRDEIDRIAGAIKATHPEFRYQPITEPAESGNGGLVRWVSGCPGDAPAYAGTDFIIARDGRIAAVYLFFDKLP